MKLYIIDAPIEGEANITRVVTSQAECASTRAELTSIGIKRKDIDTHEVDVPTTKAELVNFLNQLLSGGVKQVVANYKLTK
jgi:hypothetical protein